MLAGSPSAAADSSGSGSGDGASNSTARSGDPSQPQRPDEHLLTGAKKDKVRAAALAEYPGATVVRIETDSDGVYEAHLLTANRQPVTVEVDGDFQVTGTEAVGGPDMPRPADRSGASSGTST